MGDDQATVSSVRGMGLRTGLAIADSVVTHVEGTTAFLNGVLEEEDDQSEGYTENGKDHLVLRLRKSLYGLKQAPWHNDSQSDSERRIQQCGAYRCVATGMLERNSIESVNTRQNLTIS